MVCNKQIALLNKLLVKENGVLDETSNQNMFEQSPVPSKSEQHIEFDSSSEPSYFETSEEEYDSEEQPEVEIAKNFES